MEWPYARVEFTKKGTVADDGQLATALRLPRPRTGEPLTDVLLIAHGWNNDIADAERLFTELGDNVARLARGRAGPDRRWGVIGLVWPSVRWADDDQLAGRGLSAADELPALLDAIGERVEDPAVAAELGRLAGELENSGDARRRFLELLRSLLPTEIRAADAEEDRDDDPVPAALRAGDPEEVFAQAREAELAVSAAEEPARPAAALPDDALPPGMNQDFLASPGAVAAGLSWNDLDPRRLARRLLNVTTYYTMKDRAASVGTKGVAPLLGRLAELPGPLRLHLAGHSFGARVVTAAAAATDVPIASMTLLQAAFSHRSFSGTTTPPGAFRPLLTGRQLTGPVVVTHTHNDKAVLLAYAVASRLARQVGAGLGDARDPYGGLGANGAVATAEVDVEEMGDERAGYRFAPRRITNLRADRGVSGHGDVRNRAVANVLLQAMLAAPDAVDAPDAGAGRAAAPV